MNVPYSWCCSDTGRSISITSSSRGPFPTYVLIPEEFGGGYIKECDYKGDGIFGGKSIYELVALWNKGKIIENMDSILLRPYAENYVNDEIGRKAFSEANKAYIKKKKALLSFATQSEKQMINTFGENYLFNIGLDIACYDEQNELLPYPIKITEKPVKYEDTKPSKICVYGGYDYKEEN